MTRSLSTIVAAGVLLLLAAPAQATAPVAVDFSVLMVNGVDTAIDITSPASLTLNGVTFSYDNFGTPINELGDPVFAQAQSFGIFGNPNNGVLTMSFDVPVSELSFNYSNLSDVGAPVDDALVALLGFSNGDLNGVVVVPGNLNDPMTFDYTGPAFTTRRFSLLSRRNSSRSTASSTHRHPSQRRCCCSAAAFSVSAWYGDARRRDFGRGEGCRAVTPRDTLSLRPAPCHHAQARA